MEIKMLKVYQSVKIGNRELTFLSSKDFKLEFKPDWGCVLVDDEVCIPTNNIPWFNFEKKLTKKPTTTKVTLG